jgi:hypothetical protein
MKTFKQFTSKMKEDGAVAANATGPAIAGMGVGPKGEPGVSPTNKYKKKNMQSSPVLGMISRKP